MTSGPPQEVHREANSTINRRGDSMGFLCIMGYALLRGEAWVDQTLIGCWKTCGGTGRWTHERRQWETSAGVGVHCAGPWVDVRSKVRVANDDRWA